MMPKHFSVTTEIRRERGYKPVYVARTGNIETMSTVSAYKAAQMHERKINNINLQERNVERFSQSY
jgi:hypothetical protein